MSTYNEATVTKKINDYINKIKENKLVKGIYLFGSFGIGKTYSMKYLLESIYEEMKVGEEVIKIAIKKELVVWPDYIASLKEQFNGIKVNIPSLNELKSCKVLVIDDIGGETPSAWSLGEILFPILNYRIENKLTTFFTSNLSINELKEYYLKRSDLRTTNRVIDRIYGLTKEVKMIGINHRHQEY